MTLPTQPYKGARDFFPEDKRLQEYLFKNWRKVVEKYGYEQYDAPIIEPLELFLAKSSAEIVNDQTYAFEDRGGRKVVIRPEMTPTVSRMVAARRQELSYPLRWYSIPNLWRYERPQRGRLREHWQLNVDLFGIENLSAEHELIHLSDDLLKVFGAKPNMYKIRINNRKLVNYIFGEYLGLDPTQIISATRLIDHMHKMEYDHFASQLEMILTPAEREAGTNDKLLAILKTKDINHLPDEVKSHESVQKLNELFDLLKTSNIDNFEFDITLMRGFDYYTEIVFEVFDTHPENNRAMFGGGRYDGLVGLFNVEPIPTIGFGVGDVTFLNFLELRELLPDIHKLTDLTIILIGDIYKDNVPIVSNLREMGLKVSVDSSDNKIDKKIKSAEKSGTRYVMFVGSDEINSSQFKLKDLTTGQEESHGLDRIVSIVKDYRKKT